VNSVSVIGTLTADPVLGETRAGIPECRMRLAVARRDRAGRREPGVVYLDVSAFGRDARECAERLRANSRVGLSGRLEDDPESAGVLIDQLVFL
jgi:single-stranded DNA-binding protein